jgi:uncharacterized membrane protein YhhN
MIFYLNVIALIFCGFGDYFMELRHYYTGSDQKITFVYGILSFLVAQLTFGYLFSLHIENIGKSTDFTLSTPFSFKKWLPFLLFLTPLLFYVKAGPNVDNNIFIGVVFYAICISIMAWRAYSRLEL